MERITEEDIQIARSWYLKEIKFVIEGMPIAPTTLIVLAVGTLFAAFTAAEDATAAAWSVACVGFSTLAYVELRIERLRKYHRMWTLLKEVHQDQKNGPV